MNTTVFGLFASDSDVEYAVAKLKLAGFRNTDISCLLAKRAMEGKDFVHRRETKAPEGTATGATTGAALGGALGWLAGLGVLAIPGAGPLIAAGPLLAALAGAGFGGAVGGVAGALIGLGIPEYEAKRFEGAIREGSVMLSVHCEDSASIDKARDILERCGAENVSAASEAAGHEELGAPPPPPAASTPPSAAPFG